MAFFTESGICWQVDVSCPSADRAFQDSFVIILRFLLKTLIVENVVASGEGSCLNSWPALGQLLKIANAKEGEIDQLELWALFLPANRTIIFTNSVLLLYLMHFTDGTHVLRIFLLYLLHFL